MQLTGQWQCKWVVKSMPLHTNLEGVEGGGEGAFDLSLNTSTVDENEPPSPRNGRT